MNDFWDFAAFWEFFNPFDDEEDEKTDIKCPACNATLNKYEQIEVVDKNDNICRCPECNVKLKYHEDIKQLTELAGEGKYPICHRCGRSVEGIGYSEHRDLDKKTIYNECLECAEKIRLDEEEKLRTVQENISKEVDASGIVFPAGQLQSQDKFTKYGSTTFYLDLMTIDLKGKDRPSIIKEMVGLFALSGIVRDGISFYKSVLYTEHVYGSTALGDNFAVPHGIANIKEPAVASVAISKEGVDFCSLDKKPVNFIFMCAFQKDTTVLSIKLFAKISRLLKQQDFREQLLNVKSKEEGFRILESNFNSAYS
jgi:mannitol/fructose-specific phosphotransferase system IIA component (Ntr-type)/DNA-directed RNA polymerase subunit RPC12/RpoP